MKTVIIIHTLHTLYTGWWSEVHTVDLIVSRCNKQSYINMHNYTIHCTYSLTWSTRTERLASTSSLLAEILATTTTAAVAVLWLSTVHPLTSTGPHTPPDRQVLLAKVRGWKLLCMLLHLRWTVMPVGAVGQSNPTEMSGRQQGPDSPLQFTRSRI